MQVDLIPEWQLVLADDRQIAALLRICFETDFGGRSFFMQRPLVRLVARDAGRIVGHMALTLRAMRLGDHLIDVAGLCDVATDPDQRGKGIAAALLQTAIDQARQSPAAYFLLLGNARLYTAAGFQKAGNKVTYIDMQGARTRAVKTEIALQLMVLSLKGETWDQTAPLDMLGPLF